MLTTPYNLDPQTEPRFIAKLGFTWGMHYCFYYVQNEEYVYCFNRTRGGSNKYPQSMLRVKLRKLSQCFI